MGKPQAAKAKPGLRRERLGVEGGGQSSARSWLLWADGFGAGCCGGRESGSCGHGHVAWSRSTRGGVAVRARRGHGRHAAGSRSARDVVAARTRTQPPGGGGRCGACVSRWLELTCRASPCASECPAVALPLVDSVTPPPCLQREHLQGGRNSPPARADGTRGGGGDPEATDPACVAAEPARLHGSGGRGPRKRLFSQTTEGGRGSPGDQPDSGLPVLLTHPDCLCPGRSWAETRPGCWRPAWWQMRVS